MFQEEDYFCIVDTESLQYGIGQTEEEARANLGAANRRFYTTLEEHGPERLSSEFSDMLKAKLGQPGEGKYW